MKGRGVRGVTARRKAQTSLISPPHSFPPKSCAKRGGVIARHYSIRDLLVRPGVDLSAGLSPFPFSGTLLLLQSVTRKQSA